MNANRTKSGRASARTRTGSLPDLNPNPSGRVDSAGSGPRRRSSHHAQPAHPATHPATHPAAHTTHLPALDEPPAPAQDPELETRVFALVTAVSQEEGRSYPPEWAAVADVAKRRGYLEERALRLYLKTHGKQWLSTRAAPTTHAYTMTKIDPLTRLALKDLSHDTGVPMQEAIGHIIGAVHEHRDDLTRVARRAGLDHPWEAIEVLLKRK